MIIIYTYLVTPLKQSLPPMTHQDDKQKNVKTPCSSKFPMVILETTVVSSVGLLVLFLFVLLLDRSGYKSEVYVLLLYFILFIDSSCNHSKSGSVIDATNLGLLKTLISIFISYSVQ